MPLRNGWPLLFVALLFMRAWGSPNDVPLVPVVARRPTADDGCSSYFYARDCLQNSSCTFCCGAPIGQQCMNSAAASTSCPASQQITNTSLTCDDLCYAPESLTSCDGCVSMLWCYYCATNSSCMAANAHCQHGRVLQTCDAAVISGSSSSDQFSSNVWYRVVVYASAGAAAILLLVALLIAAQRCHVRSLLRGILRPETAPLLPHPTSPNGGDATAVGGDSALATSAGHGGAAATGAADARGESNAAATSTATLVPINSSEPNRGRGNGNTTGNMRDDDDNGSVSSGSDKMCQLCYERDATILFLPCYHVHCCANCANKLRPNRQRLEISCPFCRQRISGMVKLDALHLKKSS